MNTLANRFDLLKQHIQTEKYLKGQGNSNEANITMFCYDPKDEMEVRSYTTNLLADKELKTRVNVIEKNLYKIFIEICEDEDILNDIPDMEEEEGKESVLETIKSDIITTRQFISKMQDKEYEPGKDVILLTGVGEVFPFMRMHSLLEGMPTVFKDIPILVLYPGTFNGVELRLFNKLEPNPYYRAFNPFGY